MGRFNRPSPVGAAAAVSISISNTSGKRDRATKIAALVSAAVICAGISSYAWSGTPADHYPPPKHDVGGHVLPAKAEPFGYSLQEVARATAEFNASDHSGAAPALPFQMLYTLGTNTFTVRPGTFLYVPVLFNDDSPPVIGDFPNIRSREALVRYVYSKKQFGVQFTTITVDGKETSLGDDYLVAAEVSPLPDGGGTHYMVIAAFLSPLKQGSHTIELGGLATGAALVPWCQIVGFCTNEFSFTVEYTVNVE